MAPIEICLGPKMPPSAVVPVGSEVTGVLPNGEEVFLESTEEGFEVNPPGRSKRLFRKGEMLLFRGGMVARATKEEEDTLDNKIIIVTEKHFLGELPTLSRGAVKELLKKMEEE